MTLSEFLMERLAEDADEARKVPNADTWPLMADAVAERFNADTGWFVFRHNPARVLADVEAKRLMVRFLSDLEREEFGEAALTASLAHSALCRLASVYANHPDCHEDWKP